MKNLSKEIKTNIIFGLIFNALVTIIGIAGQIKNIFFNNSEFMGNGSGLLFFTNQSNILITILCFIFLIKYSFYLIDYKKFKDNKFFNSNILYIFKYVGTVAITITFLVFFLMLAPTMEAKYLLSFANLSVHFFVPLFSICAFYFCDYTIKFKKISFFYSLIFPLLYCIFVIILTLFNVKFGPTQDFAPYFFLNYEKYGRFKISSEGIGVFYWIIILLIAFSLLSFLLQKLMELRIKIHYKNIEKE